jgi:hypothetical protein
LTPTSGASVINGAITCIYQGSTNTGTLLAKISTARTLSK